MLDNQYAFCLFVENARYGFQIRYFETSECGTYDGKASLISGEVTIKHSSISVLSIDPEELEENYGETNYELLSDEDFEVNKNLY